MVGALRAAVFHVLLIGGMLFFFSPEVNSLLGVLMMAAAVAWFYLFVDYPTDGDNLAALIFFVVVVSMGASVVMAVIGAAVPHFGAPPPPGGY